MGDKNTGKDERITIKNDKGRPSQEEVERMVAEAEKYAKEDEAQKSRIEAKNSLESYVFNMKTSVEDEKVAEKLSEEDKKTVLDKCNEGVAWIDAKQLRRTNLRIKRRRLKVYVPQSSANCMQVLVVCQVECQVVCPVVCLVVCQTWVVLVVLEVDQQ